MFLFALDPPLHFSISPFTSAPTIERYHTSFTLRPCARSRRTFGRISVIFSSFRIPLSLPPSPRGSVAGRTTFAFCTRFHSLPLLVSHVAYLSHTRVYKPLAWPHQRRGIEAHFIPVFSSVCFRPRLTTNRATVLSVVSLVFHFLSFCFATRLKSFLRMLELALPWCFPRGFALFPSLLAGSS